MSGDLTHRGLELVRDWANTKARLERLRDDLNRAQCEADNAEIALSKWLLPPDAVVGEKVAVWFGDSLIQATAHTCLGTGQWSGPVIVRTRGKKFDETFR